MLLSSNYDSYLDGSILAESSLIGLLTDSILNESVKDYSKSKVEMANRIRKHGLNPDKLRDVVEYHAQKINWKQYSKDFDRNKQEISRSVTDTLKDIFQEVGLDQLGASLALMTMIFIIAILVEIILIIIIGPVGASILGAVVVAPIVEELAKTISIEGGYSGTFFWVFNAMEFSLYVTQMVGAGVALPVAMGIRAIPVVMHLATTVAQKRIIDSSAGENDKASALAQAHKTGVIIHGIWNFLCVALP
jgi:hypothetical protein